MRRIITETGADGASRILIDEWVLPHQMLWETTSENWLGSEPKQPLHSLPFPAGHTVVWYLEIPPDTVMAEYLKAGIPGLDERGFHRTGTIDYFILLEGRLILELDRGRAEVGPGDMVIQRDTNHAWRNPDSTSAKCISIVSRPRVGGSNE